MIPNARLPTQFHRKADLISETTIRVIFPYDPFLVEQIRRLYGRAFHKDSNGSKWWTVPLTLTNVELLKQMSVEIDPAITEWERTATSPVVFQGITVPSLKGKLRQYQKEGIGFLEARNGRALIGDEMGLGKTIQAIGWLELRKFLRPAVIICPASIKLQWKQEIENWMDGERIEILSGRQSRPLNQDSSIFIINYDVISYWFDSLKALSIKVLVVDECHKLRNRKTKWTRTILRLGAKAGHVIGLSGTPIMNRPMDFWNVLQLLDRTTFPSFFEFAQRFCGATFNGYGWDFSGATNVEELRSKLDRKILLRRTKAEVLKDLPKKSRIIVPINLDQHYREYRQALSEFHLWLREQNDPNQVEALARIEKLKQICIRGKMPSVIPWIEDYLDSEKKLVVFGIHKWTIQTLAEAFGKRAVVIDGSVPSEKRLGLVERFQGEEKVRLLIGNLQAAGTGLNLTAASATTHLELSWTPSDHIQAEDRVHRIGQEAESVEAYYLVASGTIEDDIVKILDQKRRVIGQVLDGKVLKVDLLRTLIHQIKTV